jgi:hypothetical protein
MATCQLVRVLVVTCGQVHLVEVDFKHLFRLLCRQFNCVADDFSHRLLDHRHAVYELGQAVWTDALLNQSLRQTDNVIAFNQQSLVRVFQPVISGKCQRFYHELGSELPDQ